MATFKPEPRTAAVRQSFTDARFIIEHDTFTAGLRPVVRVELRDAAGTVEVETIRLAKVACDPDPEVAQQMRQTFKRVLAAALGQALAKHVAGTPDPVVVPGDPDEEPPVTPPAP
jgi:hypothetical protein